MDTWSPALALERFELQRRVWALAEAEGGMLAPQLRLRPDRRLACAGGASIGGATLEGWDMRGETLVLLDRAAVARACFDVAEADAAGAALLRGTCTDDPDQALVLRETEPLERWPDRADRHAPQPLAELQPRRHLLVAPAGGGLAGWPRDIADADRSWDLCLLGADDREDDPMLPDYEADPPGADRWAALHTLLYPGSPLFQYDHVAFADRGVLWSWAGLNGAFAACHAHDLLLAHPTVTPAAGIAARFHPVPGRRLGFGTQVALACPIFSAEALRVCAPSFALAPAGSPELAQLWTALLGAPPTRIAVIDGIAPVSLAEARPAAASTPDLLASYGLAPGTAEWGMLRDA